MDRDPVTDYPSGAADTTTACPACGSNAVSIFYDLRGIPTNSCLLFWDRNDAVNCDVGDLSLGFCETCGYIYNTLFVPAATEYSEYYEETQGFSPTFSAFHAKLAQELIDKYDLTGKTVLEVGCGKGEFLLLLSQLGAIHGTGIDPSAIPDRIKGVNGAERVMLIPEYFSEDLDSSHVDFIACKMTLEHISDPEIFLNKIRKSLGPDSEAIVFFQIPEAYRILKTCAFEDIFYEHCAYFTPGSLTRLFTECGYSVLEVSRTYGDQYLTIECKPGEHQARKKSADHTDMAELLSLVNTFKARADERQSYWESTITSTHEAGQKIVIWGSGSKAVSFLTTLRTGQLIDCVVDINPNKAGSFMPLTGQKIVAPEALLERRPNLVIVMNRIYENEIKKDLEAMHVRAEVLCL